jgi:hypothetical protein
MSLLREGKNMSEVDVMRMMAFNHSGLEKSAMAKDV